MKRWGKWIAASVLAGVVAAALMTLAARSSWGWDFAARCVTFSVIYLICQPLWARSRRRAEEREARHQREIAEARSLFHLDQAASSSATTARTTAVIRVVLQRSFRRSRQDLRIAMARSPRLWIFAWSRL